MPSHRASSIAVRGGKFRISKKEDYFTLCGSRKSVKDTKLQSAWVAGVAYVCFNIGIGGQLVIAFEEGCSWGDKKNVLAPIVAIVSCIAGPIAIIAERKEKPDLEYVTGAIATIGWGVYAALFDKPFVTAAIICFSGEGVIEILKPLVTKLDKCGLVPQCLRSTSHSTRYPTESAIEDENSQHHDDLVPETKEEFDNNQQEQGLFNCKYPLEHGLNLFKVAAGIGSCLFVYSAISSIQSNNELRQNVNASNDTKINLEYIASKNIFSIICACGGSLFAGLNFFGALIVYWVLSNRNDEQGRLLPKEDDEKRTDSIAMRYSGAGNPSATAAAMGGVYGGGGNEGGKVDC